MKKCFAGKVKKRWAVAFGRILCHDNHGVVYPCLANVKLLPSSICFRHDLCGLTLEDKSSRWVVKRPSQYVARRLVCMSQECGGMRKYFKPQDENIPWVVGEIKSFDFPRMDKLLAPSRWWNLGSSQYRSIVVYPMPGGYSTFRQSAEVLWTLGYARHLYIERQPICLRYKEFRRSYGRFVPVEPTTPSISMENLQRFAKLFGRYDIARLLDK
jgi:hypothetical protein